MQIIDYNGKKIVYNLFCRNEFSVQLCDKPQFTDGMEALKNGDFRLFLNIADAMDYIDKARKQ